MKRISILIFALLFILAACKNEKTVIVNYSNPNIEYWGRIDTSTTEGAKLYWSGTSIKINFEGTSVQALLKDEHGNNYYNVIVDNNKPYLLQPDTVSRYYYLAANLKKGKHSVTIFKNSEWDRGVTVFNGFKIKGELLDKPASKDKKIEFYGNSITAGYAVTDTSGKDRSSGAFTNNYLSYSAITARHYNAEYQCICKSGIGITISWFPMIMPELYNRLNPTDTNSVWNFSNYTPDIVVINLFQNDSWLVHKPERAEFKANFGDTPPSDKYIINAYQQFVSKIRTAYPDAKIICMLGNMDATRKGSKWPEYIKSAVANLNDSKIYTFFMPYKETSCHPSVKEQKDMANGLIRFIDENVGWK